MYLLWSPYADLSDIEKLHASETLPMPSGIQTELKNTNNIEQALQVFKKYKDILVISNKQTYNKDTKTFDINPNSFQVALDLATAENIKELGNLLQEQLYQIDPTFLPKFIEEFNKLEIIQLSNENQIYSILEGLKNIIDKHNLYFDKITEYKLNKIINNKTLLSIYTTISDPVNLLQAHMPVDTTTKPLKDIAETEGDPDEIYDSHQRTPGNFVNKIESINDNQTGKDGIAICAVGLKGFFALTQYNNYLLNKGTAKEQEKLILGKRGIQIGETVYETLANIRSLDPNTITNDMVLEALSHVNNDKDAALILSALLSLATDNAKELCLAKLNAGTNTLGMYIYGIAIGMDFKTIAKLLMSKTARKIVEVAESNVFDQTDGYATIKAAIEYFEQLPNKYLNKYDVHNSLGKNAKIKSPLEFFTELSKKSDDFYFEDRDGREMPLNVVLTNFAKSNVTLKEKLKTLEDLRGRYRTSIYGSEVYEQLIDFLEDYVISKSEIENDYGTFAQLKTLAEGAEEMKTLGQILGLNGGIKTDYEGLTKQISNIEECIYKRSHKSDDIFDIIKFVYDPKYRQNFIERYEENKHAFNILDCLSKVPHFFQYVEALAIAKKEAQQSYKYRSVEALIPKVVETLGWHEKGKIAKGLQNYIGDVIKNNFLLDSDISMDIPAGIKAFDRNGDCNPLTESKPIRLGTDWGNATFRVFMETKVIPDLKKGIIKPGVELGTIKANKFIKDLSPDLFTKTVSSNPTILYTLPINMLPRTDIEQSLLDSYIAEFNELASYNTYNYEIIKRNADGSKVVEERSIPIKDLFTYYAMIAHNWKLSESSLVPILENFQNTGIIDAFYKYEAALDKSDEVLDNADLNEIIPYVAPRINPYSGYTQFIKAKNKVSKKMEIMQKTSGKAISEEFEDIPEGMDYDEFYSDDKINGYRFISDDIDTNYFTTGVISNAEQVIQSDITNDRGETNTLEIQYDTETFDIKRIYIGNTAYNIKNLKKVLYRKEDGRKIPRLSEMKSIIKNELYPCHA